MSNMSPFHSRLPANTISTQFWISWPRTLESAMSGSLHSCFDLRAGFAAGLLFLLPLGDLFRRRAFDLILVFVTATLW